MDQIWLDQKWVGPNLTGPNMADQMCLDQIWGVIDTDIFKVSSLFLVMFYVEGSIQANERNRDKFIHCISTHVSRKCAVRPYRKTNEASIILHRSQI